MPHGHPDFWTATIPGMPAIGAGQVVWFMSDSKSVGANSHEDLINYMVPDDMELHVCSGIVSCNFPVHQRYDLRVTPAGDWVSPTSHIDPDGEWWDEEKAYDGNVTTSAYALRVPLGWSSYLELLVNQAYIDKVRFYGMSDSAITEIDVDVYYGGAWHDVYEGTFPDGEWVEKDIIGGAQLISKARVRYYNVLIAFVPHVFLWEFQFNTAEATPQEGVYFDTHAIIPFTSQAPYIVASKSTFAVRAYNDDDAAHTMAVNLAGFLQAKV